MIRSHPRYDRETLIAAVVTAWNDQPRHGKPDLMREHGDLYWACARLAAYETVRHESR